MGIYRKFEGKKWKDIDDNDRKMLLKDAFCLDIYRGCVISNGDCMVNFAETLAAMGKVYDGQIVIADDEELYNPNIGNNGQPISQEQLDAEFEEYLQSQQSNEKDELEFEKIIKNRPHVVILGAGASVAAIPNGDANGRKISAMSGFIDKLGMTDVIGGLNLSTNSDNLEDIYMEMHEREDCNEARQLLEEKIESYFLEYVIPDEPTVYDFLLLSLRKKDIVATFNWDPLILQAYQRCEAITLDLPKLVFLHGNVGIGFCEEDNMVGLRNLYCLKCGRPFKGIPLLYPIKNKDYNSNTLIASSWGSLQEYMKKAYMVTIFGYSAPKSDVAAMNMLHNAWGNKEQRNFEQFEMIDIREEEDVKLSWNGFIHTHHYNVWDNIFDSYLGKFPRRTCDVLFDNTMNLQCMHGNMGFKGDMTFADIGEYLMPLIEDPLA